MHTVKHTTHARNASLMVYPVYKVTSFAKRVCGLNFFSEHYKRSECLQFGVLVIYVAGFLFEQNTMPDGL